jgi:nucleotide-binding universal stress UspA family protein
MVVRLEKGMPAAVTVLKVGHMVTGTGYGVVATPDEESHLAVAEEGRRIVVTNGGWAEALFRWGDPARQIVTVAEEIATDLVVVGRSRKKPRGLVNGGIAQAVAEHAPSHAVSTTEPGMTTRACIGWQGARRGSS